MKGKSFLLLFILLVPVLKASADKLETAFERLKIYDYFLAKKYFEESLKKKTPGAAFGLSIIYSSNNNPFYSLDSAKKYLLLSDSTFKLLNEKQKIYYHDFGINSISIQRLQDTICMKAFKEAELIATITQLNKYLLEFNFCGEVFQVEELRNKVAYDEARKLNTAASYKDFIETYPNANDYKEALNHYEDRLYAEATADNNVASYKNFLLNYPQSPYRMQAEKMIYALEVKDKTVDAYHDFIKNNPSNRFVNEAWRELYKLYMKDFNEAAFDNFKIQFPDYPFMTELESDFKRHRAFYIPFRKNGKWGFIDEHGDVAIPAEYDEVNFYSPKNLAAVSKNELFGYINKAGQTIIPFEYDEAETFHNNMAVISKNKKSGLISRSGDLLIPCEYDELSDPVDDVCIGTLNDKSGYVTVENKKLTPLIYDVAEDFKDGFAIVNVDEKYGLINQTGNTVIEPKYDQLFYFDENLLRAKINGKWGLITNVGEVTIAFQYDELTELSGNLAIAVKNNKFGYIDRKGKPVIPLQYKFSESMLDHASFTNGYASFIQKNKSVVIDTLGNKIMQFQFDETGKPANGLIPVRRGRKWGYADYSGKIKIPLTYEYAGSFENGYAKIRDNNFYGIMDSTGTLIIKPFWFSIVQKNGFFIVSNNNHLGLINKKSYPLLFTEYDRIEFLSETIVDGIKNGKHVYYNILLNKFIWKEE